MPLSVLTIENKKSEQIERILCLFEDCRSSPQPLDVGVTDAVCRVNPGSQRLLDSVMGLRLNTLSPGNAGSAHGVRCPHGHDLHVAYHPLGSHRIFSAYPSCSSSTKQLPASLAGHGKFRKIMTTQPTLSGLVNVMENLPGWHYHRYRSSDSVRTLVRTALLRGRPLVGSKTFMRQVLWTIKYGHFLRTSRSCG